MFISPTIFKLFPKFLSTPLTIYSKRIPSFQFCTASKINRMDFKINKTPKATPLCLITKQLDNLDSQTQPTQELIRLHSMSIEKAPLSETDKISCRKYMFSILYHKNLPIDFWLSSQSIGEIHQHLPFMQVETYLHIINRQLNNPAPDLTRINNLYFKCFEEVLSRAKQGEREKIEMVLFKNFGKYMIEVGKPEKGTSVLEKAISSHLQLIKLQATRISQYLSSIIAQTEANKNKEKAEKEREVVKLNAMKENTRRLIQSLYETLHYYYNFRKSQSKNLKAEEKDSFLVNMCSMFNQCLKCNAIVEGSHLFSRHYHRLRQIHYELEYAYAILKKNVPKIKEIRQQMLQFKKDCLSDVQDTKKYLEIQKDIILALFCIQLHLSRMEKSRSIDLIKQDLTDLAILIIEKAQMEEAKPTKEGVLKILADFIKKNLT